MGVRRIRKTAINHIHIHNDISNTANHLRRRVEEMEVAGNREGIMLDVTACLVMLAFTSESRINFIGAKKVANWDERTPFRDKLKIVLKTLGIKPDQAKRPYSAIKRLQEFRNIIAHGKPSVVAVDEVLEVGPEDQYDYVDLRADWERFLSADFMRQCSEDIDQIWKQLLEAAGIESHETLTHGSYSFALIEELPPGLGS